MTLLEQIHTHTARLTPDLQREVLDFVAFLEARRSPVPAAVEPDGATVSCLDLAQAAGLVGCLTSAPADLSTNAAGLHGYGE